MIEDVPIRRAIGDCFYLLIDPGHHVTWTSVEEEIRRASQVEQAVKAMLDGRLSVDEMLEKLEDSFYDDFDEYLEEAEANTEEMFEVYPIIEYAYR